MTDPEKLEGFLKSEGLWDLFLENGPRNWKERSLYNMIFCTFTWSESKQGFDFWNRVNRKWVRRLKGRVEIEEF